MHRLWRKRLCKHIGYGSHRSIAHRAKFRGCQCSVQVRSFTQIRSVRPERKLDD